MYDTLNDLLEDFYSQSDGRTVFVENKLYRKKLWSLRQVKQTVNKLAIFFQEKGLVKGDKVIICGKNNPFWVAIFLTAIQKGIILVPLDFNSGEEFIKEIAEKVKPKLILISVFKKSNLKTTKHIEELEREIDLADLPNISIDKVVARPSDILEIVYTSGSTDNPKGVVITQQNLYADITSLLKVFKPKNKTKTLSLLPLSHMLEQTVGLFIPLLSSVIIVYPANIKPGDILRSIEQDNITSLVCVPAFLKLFMEMIYKKAEDEGRLTLLNGYLKSSSILPASFKKTVIGMIDKRLSNLDTFFVGGAAVDKNIENFWSGLGVFVLQGYGLTEASPIVAANTYKNHSSGSVGQVLPGVELSIREGGEIWVKGENITPGYFENKEATQDSFEGDWFKTGDIGRVDEGGFLFISGRKKNVIITSNGLNIYPEDVEVKLNEFSQVKESLVLGIPKNGEIRLTAVLLLSKAGDTSPIIGSVNKELASHQQIQDVLVWPEADFPRTTTRKVIRQKVYESIVAKKEERLQTNEKGSAGKLELLLSQISGESLEKIKPKANLVTDLKMDSIKRLELLSAIETEFNSLIDESKINQETKVSDLEKLIKEYTGKINIQKDYNNWQLANSVVIIRSFLQGLVILILSYFQKIEIRGEDNLRNLDLPVIIIANHSSHFDTPTIFRALPKLRNRIIVAAARDYFFDSSLKSFFARLLFNAFPLDRDSNIRDNLMAVGYYLDNNWSVLIYPEGTRSLDGKIQEFKLGVGILAQEMDVSILPMRMDGNFSLLPKGKTFPQKGLVRVSIGEPVKVKFGLSYKETSQQLEEILKNI